MKDGVEPARSLAGLSIGHYEVRELIGRGGMGEVYRGLDRRFERPVAIKTVRVDRAADPAWRRRFLDEVRGASRVVHPYVATVFDVIEHEGSPLLVMEFVEGQRLDDVMQGGPIEIGRLARYAHEAAQALGAIHRAGLIHCDVKPANVVLTRDDHIKVMDFGLASRNPAVGSSPGGSPDSSTETAVDRGHLRGTLAYMSPEQLRGQPADARSDLFSLGVVLFEGLHGSHPFLRPSANATISAILSEPPRGVGSRPFRAPFGRVIRGLLEKDPARRCPNADALIERLETVMRVPRRAAWAAWATLAALAVACAVWLWLRGPAPRPAVAILPFIDHTGTPASAREGALIADALAARLGSSTELRVVSGERVGDLLASLPAAAGVEERLDRLRAGLAAEWSIAGELFLEQGEHRAVVRVRRGSSRDPVATFSVKGQGVIDAAESATVELRRILGEEARPVEVEDPSRPVTQSAEAEELFRRARQLEHEERYGDALLLLERALERDAGYLPAMLLQAEIQDEVGFERKAREAIDRAEELLAKERLSRDSRLALELRAARATIYHREADAVEVLGQLVERYPDEPQLRLDLAGALRGNARYAEALSMLDDAQRLDRFDPRIFTLRADVLCKQGFNQAALATLDEARRLVTLLDLREARARIAHKRGYVLYAARRLGDARQAYAEAAGLYRNAGLDVLALEPEKSVADMDLADWRLEDAARAYRAILPDASAAGHFSLVTIIQGSLGGLYMRLRQLDDAEAALRAAIDEAIKLEDEARALGPKLNLAAVLNLRQKLDEARALGSDALELARRREDASRTAAARTCLAESDRRAGLLTAAEATLRELIDTCDPAHLAGIDRCLTASEFLIHVLLDREALPEAEAVTERAVALAQESGRGRTAAYQLLLRAIVRASGPESGRSGARADLVEAERRLAGEPPYAQMEHTRRLARALLLRADGAWAELLAEADPDRSAATVELIPLLLLRAEALQHMGRRKEAEALLRDCRAHPWASAADRVQAAVALAQHLAAGGQAKAAAALARTAAAEAERLSMPIAGRRAALILSRAGA